MKQTSSNFTKKPEYKKGYESESVIAKILREKGYYVIITADNKERNRRGAPGARSNNDFITLPDLDVTQKGFRAFVEVKYKYEASYTEITKREEHGLGLRKWEMYRKAQIEFGTIVILMICEGKTGDVLYSSINDLEPFVRYYHGNKMDAGGMVFFPRTVFKIWDNVSELFETEEPDDF